MTVKRLDHVNIQTHRFDESLRFYAEGLGLRPGPLPSVLRTPTGEPVRAAWLYDAGGNPIVHLIRWGEDGAATPAPAHFDHLALACEDLEGFAARLGALGYAFDRVSYPQYGIEQLVVRDPNGIKIELGFSPPVVEDPAAG